ncbi:MAG TPA: hypothetical protein VH817_02815 [Thermoleophilaceae bacterium]
MAVLAMLSLAACGSGSSSSNTTPTQAAAAPVKFPKSSQKDFANLAHSIGAKSPILAATGQDFTPGVQRFGFGLFNKDQSQLTDAPVALYVQAQGGGKVYGPFVAHQESLEVTGPYLSETVQKDPASAKSFYAATVRFPHPGKYNVLGVVKDGEQVLPTGTGVKVAAKDPIPAVGQKPPMISTPTVASVAGDVGSIDTRQPPDDMHNDDFKDVVGKKPVVLVFATPLLCQSRVCGPVVDIAEDVKHTDPDAKDVDFIHMEVYNKNDANKGYRPQLTAFHLETEPWLFVFDKSGRISTRIEGAFSKEELQAAIAKAVKQ